MKKVTTLLILLYGYLLSGFAQPYCDVRTFNIFDGLAANNIGDINQAPDHIMWFGTWNGLCYYDGYSFRTFRGKDDSANMLMTNRIRSIDIDANNDIWTLTIDGHPYVYSTHYNDFRDFGARLDHELHMDHSVTHDIFTLANGATWLSVSSHKCFIRIPAHEHNARKIDYEVLSEKQGNMHGTVLENVVLDSGGREWLFTDKGVYLYNGRFNTDIDFDFLAELGSTVFLASKEGDFGEYTGLQKPKIIPLPSGVRTINTMVPLDSHRMLLGTNQGVVVYDRDTQSSRVVNVQSPNSPSPNVTKLFVDNRQRIWAFTDGSGITLIDSHDFHARWLMADASSPELRTACRANLIMEDEHNTVWLVPRDGTFSYYDEETQQLVAYPLYTRPNDVLPVIHRYFISDQSILWVSNNPSLVQVNFKYHDFFLKNLVKEHPVRAIALDHNGKYVCGMNNGLLALVDVNKKNPMDLKFITPQGTLSSNQIRFANEGIYSLFIDSLQRLWVGTKGDGLYVVNPKGAARHYLPDAADRYSVNSRDIYDIQADRRGRIWIATYGAGVNIVDESHGGIRFLNSNNVLAYPKKLYNKVRRIAVTCTNNNEMALCTTDGLVSFSQDFKDPRHIKYFFNHHVVGDTSSLRANDVLQLFRMSNGRMFITTIGGAIQEVGGKSLLSNKLTFKRLPMFDEGEGNAQSITEDNREHLWVVRESTVDCLDTHSNHVNVFGPNDFDQNTDFTEARPYHDPHNDRISLGLNTGLLSFIPSRLTKTVYSPKIVFTYAQMQRGEETIPILHSDELKIPANKRAVTIYFSALDYSRDYQMKYAYRIKGRDMDWNYIGSRNFISFNDIPSGEMTLLVKSTNTHGVWSDNVASLDIVAQPHFAETIWFKLLLLALFGVAVYFLFNFHFMKQRIKLNKEMNRMKADFYSNASHQLRTPLTLIGGPVTEILDHEPLSEKAQTLLEMVNRNAGNMLNLVNSMLEYENHHFGVIDDNNAKTFISKFETMNANDIVVETGNKDYTILVVEDNNDLRAFLYNILKDEYNVVLAENGAVGLEKARATIPDFILTDVTMPVMDGLTMIHEIRQDDNISHIPIIILSARASMEDMERGNKEGIVSYITKPFSATYLKGRIENVIAQRHMAQQEVLNNVAPESDNAPQESAEGEETASTKTVINEFVDKEDEMKTATIQNELDATVKTCVDYIDAHIRDQELKIDDICRALGMSRSVLYGKIKTAVGMTPVDFVRHIRILRAEKMISQSEKSFSAIAYEVGFTDPKYFSKVFKKVTGMTPSEYREKS